MLSNSIVNNCTLGALATLLTMVFIRTFTDHCKNKNHYNFVYGILSPGRNDLKNICTEK